MTDLVWTFHSGIIALKVRIIKKGNVSYVESTELILCVSLRRRQALSTDSHAHDADISRVEI